MREFTVPDLDRIIRESAGDDGRPLQDGELDASFDELGYDSLAILEMVSRISREFDAPLADDIVGEARTPRRMLEMVNETLSATAL